MNEDVKKIKEWTDKMDYNLAVIDITNINGTVHTLNRMLDTLHTMENSSKVYDNKEVMEFSSHAIDTVRSMKARVLEIRQKTLRDAGFNNIDPVPLDILEEGKD